MPSPDPQEKANSGGLFDDLGTYIGKLTDRGDRAENFSDIASNLIFPIDLPMDETIKFEIYKEYKFDRTEETEGQTLANIYLPIPQNLSTSYKAQYDQTELGFPGLAAAQAVNGDFSSLSGDGLAGGALNMLSQSLESGSALPVIGGIIGGAIKGASGGLAGLVTGAVAGTLGQQVVKGAMHGAGVARNPHMAQVFRNVDFRSHTFQYKFAPKSLAESNALKNIYKALKLAMHPRYFLENHFFDYPAQFGIDILGDEKENEYLFEIGPSVLTDLTFDPTPNGPYFHYENGKKIPVAVALNMTFTEIKIVTQSEIARHNY